MRRTFSFAYPRVLSATSFVLARAAKTDKGGETHKADPAHASGATPAEATDGVAVPPDNTVENEPENGTHIRPQSILTDILDSISVGQDAFLFGSHKDAEDLVDGVPRATGTFFESINTAYEGRMLQERQEEVEKYGEKCRIHFAQRLDKETEEYRQEQEEIHKEIQRVECEKYKSELSNDILHFAKAREAEYEARLHADVEKYYNALLAFQSRTKKTTKAKAAPASHSTQLDLNVQAIMDEMELEDSIRDFGEAAGSGTDITDRDIRSYVIQRTSFYETCAQDEVHDFTVKRKAFYEELMEARDIRHAAKVRADTEKFRAERQVYYDDRLAKAGSWMTECFKEHYNKCFLQCYARKAWADHRRYEAEQEGINVSAKEGEKVPRISDPSTVSIDVLSAEIPLSQILDIYESETITEVTRDAFLKAARRVAESAAHSHTDAYPPE